MECLIKLYAKFCHAFCEIIKVTFAIVAELQSLRALQLATFQKSVQLFLQLYQVKNMPETLILKGSCNCNFYCNELQLNDICAATFRGKKVAVIFQ
ncbi:hypothetical protein [Fastidiosibacter lacustris]|uniref:hypothetical protein n=1 Tax=Fastidiosibacter lacustris TaxID=2056695 RepID=UPI000E351ED4|nr:hypothetical protein [Fastidiosibacter lacustris]